MSAKLHTLISGVGYGNESAPMHQRIYDEIVKEVREEARAEALAEAIGAVENVQGTWGLNEEGWPYAAIGEALDAMRKTTETGEAP